jgi:hypothetical protein
LRRFFSSNGAAIVFGNKGYRWKLGAGLALIAGLGVSAALRGEGVNPSVWRCLASPAIWEGTRIWVPGARIVAVHERDYEIKSGDARIRVSGPAPAAVDSRIALIAVFHQDGPSLEPVRTRLLPVNDGLRRLMEGVSILVTLAVLGNFARHFLFRPKVLQVEGVPD